mmetsp:Transcript_22630/g.28901  ORF Transcript_22630/g.28901 Transcript_22630/m.28901 type:complete len:204 (+) Transcript_22630:544-1155(+)
MLHPSLSIGRMSCDDSSDDSGAKSYRGESKRALSGEPLSTKFLIFNFLTFFTFFFFGDAIGLAGSVAVRGSSSCFPRFCKENALRSLAPTLCKNGFCAICRGLSVGFENGADWRLLRNLSICTGVFLSFAMFSLTSNCTPRDDSCETLAPSLASFRKFTTRDILEIRRRILVILILSGHSGSHDCCSCSNSLTISAISPFFIC